MRVSQTKSWGWIGFITIILLVISSSQTNHVIANPLPRTFDQDSEGSLFPIWNSSCCKFNYSVFMKAEIINVTFDKKIASVSALYIIKNKLENKTIIELLLPFARKPFEVKLTVEGKERNYTWINIDSLDIPDTYPFNLTVHSVSNVNYAILFLLDFDSSEEKEVLITYDRNYGVTNIQSYDKINFLFKYIIGTARWWNRTINSAYFEFWIKKVDYYRGNVSTSDYNGNSTFCAFSSSVKNGYKVLSVNYSNWMPLKDDYLILSWQKNKPFFETSTGKSLLIIGLTVISFGSIAAIIQLYKKKK